MIGSLVKFSVEKRQLYFPTSHLYGFFDGEVGLVTSHTKNDLGDEYVRVRWLKPVLQKSGHKVEESDFNLLNFEVLNKAETCRE